jgi:cell shape-determining protein MreC
MGQMTEAGVTILMAIVGVAILALLISQKSNTVGVIQAAASGFSNTLGVAMSPVTGAQVRLNTAYPTNSLGSVGGLGSLGGLYQ